MNEIKWEDFQKIELRVGTIIEVEKFPAFIIIDDKGNDFYNI